MTIGNRKALDKALKKHAAARKSLNSWLEMAQRAQCQNIMEARLLWQTADVIKGTRFTCFNIGGNSFRLIATVSYVLQEIVIEELLTHAEYTEKYVKRKGSF